MVFKVNFHVVGGHFKSGVRGHETAEVPTMQRPEETPPTDKHENFIEQL